MATYPTTGSTPWGPTLKAYIDGNPQMAPNVTHSVLTYLNRGADDVHILCWGESTSDMVDYIISPGSTQKRWSRRLMETLATEWPAYTVVENQWLDASGSSTLATANPFSWHTPLVMQSGTAGTTTRGSATGSTANNVITDASVASGDLGKRVIGRFIPPRSYVGTVTAGVSYLLVDINGNPQYPTGSVSGITLSAAPVLSLWNASVSGARVLYAFGANQTAQLAVTLPDLIIVAHGHNELSIASIGREQFRQDILNSVEMLTELCPGAPVILTGENPRTDTTDEVYRSSINADIAGERGYGFVDVYRRFTANTNWVADWMFDTIHPNDNGYAEWADEIHRMFVYPSNSGLMPPAVTKSLFLMPPGENLLPAGSMLEWPVSGLPAGWTTTNATVTRDSTTFPGAVAMKVVSTAANGRVTVPLDITRIQGQWITATVRVRYDTPGVDLAFNGGFVFNYTDAKGTAVQTNTSWPAWRVNSKRNGDGAWFYQSSSMFVPPGAQSVRLFLYGDQQGGSAATYYRRIIVTRGRTPAGDVPLPATYSRDPSLLLAPTGAVAQTYDRGGASDAATIALPAAGTCLVTALPIATDCTLTTAKFRTGGTAGAGTAGNVHQWIAILDSTGKVVAVTADQTLTAMTTFTPFSWNFSAATAVKSGLYYACVLISMNTTQPTVEGINTNNTAVEAPILAGAGSTGQTTAPAVGATLTLPASALATRQYVWAI